MIKDIIALAVAALILWLLAGCAVEPQAPIETYRALYGFTPTRD